MSSDIQINLDHRFNDFQLQVSIDIPVYGVTALFGPSGSGKSTLLRCIAGLEKANGSLKIGDNIWQDDKIFISTHERPIGFVFQEAALFPHLSVFENLKYGLKRQPKHHHHFSLDDIIELLGIKTLLARKPNKLSGGEKQRVAIARALAVNPEVLLMDEPLAALDTQRKQEILPYLEATCRNLKLPIIYVTHSIDEVARLADHLVLIHNGKIQASGRLNETLSHLTPTLDENQTGVVIEATISQIDPHWHLALASFDQGEIWVRNLQFAIDDKVRFQILARDVSLALSSEHQSSISNILPATVDDIITGNHPAIRFVRLRVGHTYILSRLMQRSLHTLNIRIGDTVWAQIKAAAIVE